MDRSCYGEPKMIFDQKRDADRCGQAIIKNSPKKNYSIFNVRSEGLSLSCEN